jgi:hypothetical protein
MKTLTLKQSALAVGSLVSINLALLPTYDEAIWKIHDHFHVPGPSETFNDFLIDCVAEQIVPTLIGWALLTWVMLKITGKASSMFLNLVKSPQMPKYVQLLLSLGTIAMYFAIVFPTNIILVAPALIPLIPFQLYVGRKNAPQSIKKLSLL